MHLFVPGSTGHQLLHQCFLTRCTLCGKDDPKDILVLKVVKRLLDTGVSLQQIRTAVGHLRERGVEDLAQITLMSDGASIYECRSADEVVDLVRGGQGVFGIAVGSVWREVEGTLATLPAEVHGGQDIAPAGVTDELAQRRAQRAAG
mgnify:CR=1 FL=1